MKITFNYNGEHLTTMDFPPPLRHEQKQELEELNKKYKVTKKEGTRPVDEVVDEWLERTLLHDIYKKTGVKFLIQKEGQR
jgi:hypothetical protein